MGLFDFVYIRARKSCVRYVWNVERELVCASHKSTHTRESLPLRTMTFFILGRRRDTEHLHNFFLRTTQCARVKSHPSMTIFLTFSLFLDAQMPTHAPSQKHLRGTAYECTCDTRTPRAKCIEFGRHPKFNVTFLHLLSSIRPFLSAPANRTDFWKNLQ